MYNLLIPYFDNAVKLQELNDTDRGEEVLAQLAKIKLTTYQITYAFTVMFCFVYHLIITLSLIFVQM